MTANPALVQQLSAYKASGMSAADAAAALMGGGQASGSGGAGSSSSAGPIGASDLCLALAAVFGPGLTAAVLAAIIHKSFPDLPALGVAEAVLAALPNTSQTEMDNALILCGFSATDAQGAVNILYPVNVTVQANQSWQPTGVTVTGQQQTAIVCTGGSWTANPADGNCGANGNSSYTAKSGYTMPGQPEGALIGQIGTNAPFLVGASVNAPSGQSGMLSLCINDDLNGEYGAGLTDNSGALTVTVTTTATS